MENFSRVWAAATLLLIGATYRLWVPVGEYPDVPLFAWAGRIPTWLDAVVLASVVASAFVLLFRPRSRGAWWIVAFGLLTMFAVDQQRLQPWAYQSVIYACVLATVPTQNVRAWLIPLAASVYLYSAAGKLDFQFAHTVGQDFLKALAAPFSVKLESWDSSLRVKLALLLPLSEFLIGLGCLLPRTRRIAGVAAIGMHSTLLAILGPWSLNHSWGVLTWNACLIVQAWFLFVAPQWPTCPAVGTNTNGREHVATTRSSVWRLIPASLTKVLVILALGMPLFERSGYWDHWLSWSLYSPHSSRVRLELHSSVLDRLGDAARAQVVDDDDGDGWHEFSLGRWSLESRGVPIYPQARYQLGLAIRLAEEFQIDREVRVILQSVSDRRTGRRTETRLLGGDELRHAAKGFWLLPPVEDRPRA